MWGWGEGTIGVAKKGVGVDGGKAGGEGEVWEVGAVNKQDLIIIKAIKTKNYINLTKALQINDKKHKTKRLNSKNIIAL